MGTLIERLNATDGGGQSGPIKKEAAERIAELEEFAAYVLANCGERTIRDMADEVLKSKH